MTKTCNAYFPCSGPEQFRLTIDDPSDVRLGSLAEAEARFRFFRSSPDNRHRSSGPARPLSAISGPITPVGLAPGNEGNSDPLQECFFFRASQFGVLAAGFVSSFFVALLSIKFLLAFVRTRTFIPFGIYRIVVALAFAFI